LRAELTEHLGYEKGDPAGRGQWQQPQRLELEGTEDGEIEIAVPRAD